MIDLENLTTIGIRRFTSLPSKVPADVRVKVKPFSTRKWACKYRCRWTYVKNHDSLRSALHRTDLNRIITDNRK